MKVWFGCTTAQWQDYKHHYFAIRNYLRELGCVVLFDWLDEADKFYGTDVKTRNIKKIYSQVIQAIDECDASIIEYTVPNFSSSHQINFSIFRKKPTLVLRLFKDNNRFSDSYIEAIESPYLSVKEYTEESYQQILRNFVGQSKMALGQQRYNIVLDKKHKYYLDWASVKRKKSRSLLIRNFIERAIEEDTDYQKYVGTKV